MADCSYYRCIQERRSIKRELQKWYKDMVYIVGESKIPYFISILDRKCLEVLPDYPLLHFYASTIIARCSRRRIRRRRWRKKLKTFSSPRKLLLPVASNYCAASLFRFRLLHLARNVYKSFRFFFPSRLSSTSHPCCRFCETCCPSRAELFPRIQIKSAPEIHRSSGRTKSRAEASTSHSTICLAVV